MFDESRSLQQIEGENWGNPETAATAMVSRCLRLRRTPLKDFTLGDLRLMISQKIGLETLVPKAIEIVSIDPLLEADFYSGDLLCALLRLDKAYWAASSAEHGQLVVIATATMCLDGRIAGECQAFLR